MDEEDLPQLRAAAAAAAAASRPRSLAAAPVGDLDSDVSLTHGIGTRQNGLVSPHFFVDELKEKIILKVYLNKEIQSKQNIPFSHY